MNKYYRADEVEKLLSCGCAYAIWELPTTEVSEDCIDRYSALAELDPRSYEYKAVKELPNVIPKRSCYRCGLREDCEDSTERKPKEGEWIMSDLKNKIMDIYDVRPSTAEYIQNIIEMIVAIAENEYIAGAETKRSSK